MDRGRTTRARIVAAMKCQFNDALALRPERANTVGKPTGDPSDQKPGCLERVFQINFHRCARPLSFNRVFPLPVGEAWLRPLMPGYRHPSCLVCSKLRARLPALAACASRTPQALSFVTTFPHFAALRYCATTLRQQRNTRMEQALETKKAGASRLLT
jgi:hypothetical protein